MVATNEDVTTLMSTWYFFCKDHIYFRFESGRIQRNSSNLSRNHSQDSNFERSLHVWSDLPM